MERYGLLGEKLSHSLSPLVHSKLCSVPYDLFEKSPDGAEDFIRNGDFAGINVTIPYKVKACCLCDVLSPEAERIGAVNTVVRRGDTLYGYNTDYFGFIYSVRRSGADVAGKKCLVLGSGGASKAVTAALRDLGAGEIKVISRSGEDNYGNLSRHRDARVIVNATPLGMYPNCGVSPVDLNTFPDVEFVYDLIFNPMKTKLLLDAERLGIPFDGGLRMLVAQAKKSSDLFLGVERDDGIIEEICLAVRRMALNVILVGMPGSGKTRVGKLVAEATGQTLRRLRRRDRLPGGQTDPGNIRKRRGRILPPRGVGGDPRHLSGDRPRRRHRRRMRHGRGEPRSHAAERYDRPTRPGRLEARETRQTALSRRRSPRDARKKGSALRQLFRLYRQERNVAAERGEGDNITF